MIFFLNESQHNFFLSFIQYRKSHNKHEEDFFIQKNNANEIIDRLHMKEKEKAMKSK